MKYWLVKTEPGTYSWDDLKKDGYTFWDGVRNYQARNYLQSMKNGDLALFYHSVNEKCIKGIAEIIRESYQDPTTEDEAWVAVDIKFHSELEKEISLSDIKSKKELSDMVLVKNSRLSVQPVSEQEFMFIKEMAQMLK